MAWYTITKVSTSDQTMIQLNSSGGCFGACTDAHASSSPDGVIHDVSKPGRERGQLQPELVVTHVVQQGFEGFCQVAPTFRATCATWQPSRHVGVTCCQLSTVGTCQLHQEGLGQREHGCEVVQETLCVR
jgi:hypothetical protein